MYKTHKKQKSGKDGRKQRIQELINFINLNLCLEAASSSAIQEFPNIFQNRKVHYRVHNSLLFVPILSQMNPVRNIQPYISKILFSMRLKSSSFLRSLCL
jgi:hypothetical protein